jgi:DNA-binding MarR family transcriptional regulator
LPVSEESQAYPSLKSSFLTVITLLFGQLTETLADAADLNATEYRLLLKTYELANKRTHVGDLASILGIQSNVVTQAADVLEARGLMKRSGIPTDGRVAALSVTREGLGCIKWIDSILYDHITSVWSPIPDDMFRIVQEGAVAIGAKMESSPVLPDAATAVVSAYLTTIVEIRKGMKEGLRAATGASLAECHIVLELAEMERPVRAIDVGKALALPPSTITRAADRLETRGWARRLRNPDEAKAVYLELTDEGRHIAPLIQASIDAVAAEKLWNHLTPEQRATVGPAAALIIQAR